MTQTTTQLKFVASIIEDNAMLFYVADDEDLTPDLNKAFGFDSIDEALSEVAIINQMWDLGANKMFAIGVPLA